MKLRILVADDNPLTLHYFVDALTSMGIYSVTANNGEEAVAFAQNERFDMLLFDTNMPRMNGPTALKVIRADTTSACHRTPALASTAASDGMTHTLLLEAGFADVLFKPLTLGRLRTAIQTYLPPPESLSVESHEIILLNDTQALTATGGDASIMLALRELFRAELIHLPQEIDMFANKNDTTALRERLHRLEASAGFCGAQHLSQAINGVRDALNHAENHWPTTAVTLLLETSAHTSRALASNSISR